MSVTNLTPHPIRIYGWGVPDRIDPADHREPYTIEPSGAVARIGEIELGTQNLRGVLVPVELVEFHHVNGLPPASDSYDDNTDWYVVSLALALQMVALPRDKGGRSDLLVPYREVRNLDGTVIGCRSLALPV